jgi:hypothetical protein
VSGPLRQRVPTQPSSSSSSSSGNGYRPNAGVAVASGLSTRVRPKGYAALAVALLVGFGALGFWFYTSAGHKVPVVVAVRDIPLGHTIARGDLSTVEVAGGVTAVAGDHLSSLVGQTAAVAIVANTLVQRSMITTGSTLPAGAGLVGVAAAPGQIPSSGLSPGDTVEVLQLSQKGDAPSASSPVVAGQAVLVKAATVFDVRANSSSSGGTLLTLVVPQTAAFGVAQASNAGLIALVTVGG